MAAPSPLSAKNSMKTKMTTEMTNSTTQSGPGMTPTAPWTRSIRAASRSSVWSSHFPYAASSLAVRGWTVLMVWKSSTPHGLMASPSVPASARGHSS